MKKLLYIIILFSSISFAQAERQKWEKKDVSYLLPIIKYEDDLKKNNSFGVKFLSTLKKGYSKIISDYDGDNCPFSPSCADFFVQAVGETNILTGILMFADRFTRDMNFLKSSTHYSIHKSGKYYDPPQNYLLSSVQNKIEPIKK